MKKTTIILLNWNGYADTRECILSLLKINYDNYNILLVDNNSADQSVEKLSAEFPQIDYLKLDKNYGYAEGNNIGIRYAQERYSPDYFLVLNNDTVVDGDFLTYLADSAESDEKVIAVSPKIYFYYAQNRLYFGGGRISKISGLGIHLGWKKKDKKKYSISKEVSFLNGCCMLFKSNIIEEIGLFDPIYFANNEDADLSERINKSPFIMRYQPKSIIWHKEGIAKKQNKGNWFNIYVATRNILIFQSKHANLFQILLFIPFFSVRWVLYLVLKNLYLKDYKTLRGIFIGIKDGFTKRLRFDI